ncbi:hypothetical protein AJ78_04445 [Emergomyces pasteurianus Ep9510]|uniref:Uncharacterized protein n=1 Tax=Emergomyces pasteurianus Ep9510 TaxID=1447872 RepID=A0A1J9PFT2_9EURO|nr:hypothetical protein AJ78_04445 [Emergomyces pasteurianus Ep9510]
MDTPKDNQSFQHHAPQFAHSGVGLQTASAPPNTSFQSNETIAVEKCYVFPRTLVPVSTRPLLAWWVEGSPYVTVRAVDKIQPHLESSGAHFDWLAPACSRPFPPWEMLYRLKLSTEPHSDESRAAMEMAQWAAREYVNFYDQETPELVNLVLQKDEHDNNRAHSLLSLWLKRKAKNGAFTGIQFCNKVEGKVTEVELYFEKAPGPYTVSMERISKCREESFDIMF